MRERWLSRAWRCLLASLLMTVALADGAGATVVLNLGTAGNAAAWTGSACGTASPVFQFGGMIGLSGGVLMGNARCGQPGSWVATESFALPAEMRGITLRLSDFDTTGQGELRLNGVPVRSDGATITSGLTVGGLNRLDIVFGGTGRLGFAELTAVLTYEHAAAAADAGAPVPEPHSGGLLAGALLAIGILWRGPGRPLVGRYSAAARRAPPSMLNV